MIWETLFFASGSVFFLLSIIILLAVGFYLLKIVYAALSIEREIKSLAGELKNKVNALSIAFAGLAALLEKLIQLRWHSDNDSGKDAQDNSKSERKTRKIKIAQSE